MRLQRYPDGANEWRFTIASRHPSWSRTWTWVIDVVKHRRESGQTRWGVCKIPGPQTRRIVTAFGISLQLVTQEAMAR